MISHKEKADTTILNLGAKGIQEKVGPISRIPERTQRQLGEAKKQDKPSGTKYVKPLKNRHGLVGGVCGSASEPSSRAMTARKGHFTV